MPATDVLEQDEAIVEQGLANGALEFLRDAVLKSTSFYGEDSYRLLLVYFFAVTYFDLSCWVIVIFVILLFKACCEEARLKFLIPNPDVQCKSSITFRRRVLPAGRPSPHHRLHRTNAVEVERASQSR